MTSPIDLPLVDISKPDYKAAGKAMLNAAVEYGFLYIDSRTTAFTEADVESAFDLSKEFFDLPVSEKAPYKRGPDNVGWVGMHVETLDPEHHKRGDFKEALNILETKNGKIMQPLPPSTMNREAEIARFSDLCNQTCIQILNLLAHGLEMSDDFFTSRHDSSKGYTGNSVRLLYYPSDVPGYCAGKDIRAGAHSDYGSITLLFQRPGQPGLEMQTPEQEWAPVPVYPNQDEYPFPPILVNIGDALSYWTDGLLKSTVHRVVFPEGGEGADRYSIAFFCSPLGTTELIPVPSGVVAAHREKQKEDGNPTVGYGGGASELNVGGRRLTAGEHLQARLAATYL
ncbi:uncharacterized protein N7503_011807 [Penicillium pulvis]|uniref:uncharacterized protein n=1 Tax=Penicillium pulvis TaxID=1562058 RepID=UPI00254837E9|nr:uncharacterized protein N7503_011807 [Penicillium pulvis]KAJ5786595.1 hypothetical protein N7503_011807 [Penicillium pulvis]